MTRVAPTETSDTEKEKELRVLVREEVQKGIGRGLWRAKLKSCFGCLLLWLIMLLVGTSLALYLVSETGLIRVPFFSRFYAEPRPVRIVTPSNTPVEQAFTRELQGAQAQARRSGTASIVITLREEDLTRSLQDFAETNRELFLPDAQLAVLEGSLELFVPIKVRGRRSIIRVRVLPELVAGELGFRVQKAQIGELAIWHRLLDAAVENAFGPQLAEINRLAHETMSLESIVLRPGTIEITGSVAPAAGR